MTPTCFLRMLPTLSRKRKAFIAAPLLGTIIFLTSMLFIVNLSKAEAVEALNRGLSYANHLAAEGLIAAATLHLSGITAATSDPVIISTASGQQVGADCVDA